MPEEPALAPLVRPALLPVLPVVRPVDPDVGARCCWAMAEVEIAATRINTKSDVHRVFMANVSAT
jgi:hypothetical protein